MQKRLFIISLCFHLLIPLQAVAEGGLIAALTGKQEVSQEEYQASEGDSLVVDLASHTGYLVSGKEEIYASFPVLSGQKRYISYLGRTYFAATPQKNWEVKEQVIQGDKVTFSQSGEFLRLFDEGKRTSYGIHGHKYWDVMYKRGNPYVSYGCVLVQDHVLNLIQESFLKNNGYLRVTTQA